jgi:amino acid transporter
MFVVPDHPFFLYSISTIEQMTEETKNAAMSGSIGIVMAIGVSAILGWFLILGLLFSIQDLDTTLASGTGQPVTQIFLDTVGENGAIVLMVRFINTGGASLGNLNLNDMWRRLSSSVRCSSAVHSLSRVTPAWYASCPIP